MQGFSEGLQTPSTNVQWIKTHFRLQLKFGAFSVFSPSSKLDVLKLKKHRPPAGVVL